MSVNATVSGPWSGLRYDHLEGAITHLGHELKNAPAVDTGHWQSLKDVPQTKTRELRAVNLTYSIPDSVGRLQIETQPNMPWAENHFQERVCGEPLNPGVQYKHWPWYRGNVETHKEQGEFSHTYMERYWPREAGQDFNSIGEIMPRRGIRYRYGDLNDVIDLLKREPYTRQAYLPVWFPEDTGAHHNERVPCTLGYHFMLRDGELHCFYPIRSCDFLRHFRDDIYLTCRLVQWVLDMLKNQDEDVWSEVKPGELTMFIHSLHIFEGDLSSMVRKYGCVISP